MISVYDLKPAFQRLLRPLVERLGRGGVTANQITTGAALLSIAHGAWIALAPSKDIALCLLPATLFLRMALNAIDGMLAREHGQKTRLGALLNELGDAFSDLALYLPFALVPGVSATAVVIAVVVALVAELAGVCALSVGSGRRYDGPMGKSDRALTFGLLGLLLGLGWTPGWLSDAILWGVAVLGLVTVWNRARKALEVEP
jgi:CDP-diacylglycerol--glycerol-3-phosphate 3-phosphatidyltransferase